MNFTYEKKLLHNLILHANDLPIIGLLDGQMGITLALSEYIRLRKLPQLNIARDFLLDQLISNITSNTSLSFSDGLTGIGWGIEYLLQKKFQHGSSVKICNAIDQKLMQHDIRRCDDLDRDYGFEGWLHYIIAHIQGARMENKYCFDTIYLNDICNRCKLLLEQAISPSLRDLCMTYIQIYEGKNVTYEFNLFSFINTNIKKSSRNLGVRCGQAGLLLTLIQNDLT